MPDDATPTPTPSPEPLFCGVLGIDPSRPYLVSLVRSTDAFVYDFTRKDFVPGDTPGGDLLRAPLPIKGTLHAGRGLLWLPDFPAVDLDGQVSLWMHDPAANNAVMGDPVPVSRAIIRDFAAAFSFTARG